MRGLLELRGLFEGGSYMRKYGTYTHQGHLWFSKIGVGVLKMFFLRGFRPQSELLVLMDSFGHDPIPNVHQISHMS